MIESVQGKMELCIHIDRVETRRRCEPRGNYLTRRAHEKKLSCESFMKPATW